MSSSPTHEPETLATLDSDDPAAGISHPMAHPPIKREFNFKTIKICLAYAIVLVVVAVALDWGIQLRRWAWDYSTNVRLVVNMRNAIDWGRYANKVGTQRLYDILVDTYGEEGDYRGVSRGAGQISLDYPPLRLLIAARWADWAQRNFPAPHENIRWRPDYKFNEPMLWSNTIAEMLGAAAMFLLVRFWFRRSDNRPSDPLRGLWQGLVAALLVWFCPAVIWDGHCYPQWDAWLLAPFLLAVYLILNNGWLVAGLVVGVASMAKGQILMVMPLLLLWPILTLRVTCLLRMGIGFLLGVVASASLWLIPDAAALEWVISVAVAMVALLPLFFMRAQSRRNSIVHGVSIWLAALILLGPFVWQHNFEGIVVGIAVLGGLGVSANLLPLRSVAAWACAGVVAAVLLCIPLYNGSMNWYIVGIVYATRHWRDLAWLDPFNLSAILEVRYHWRWTEKIDLANYWPFLHQPYPVLMRHLLAAIYATFLLLCAIILPVHVRRRDRRLLYVIVAPWLLMFALLPQMLPRYLVWPSALAAGVAVTGVDGFLLYLTVNLINCINMAREMIVEHELAKPIPDTWVTFLENTYPGIGWAVLLLAAIWLYVSLTPMRKRPALPDI